MLGMIEETELKVENWNCSLYASIIQPKITLFYSHSKLFLIILLKGIYFHNSF